MNPHDPASAPRPEAAETLTALLRGELSAVATYDLAIGTFEGGHIAAELNRIRDAHRSAAAALRDRLTAHGGVPPESSGPWGVFAPAVASATAAVGPATVLYALKRGEEHGIGEYEAALSDERVQADCKNLIRSDLLPRSRGHALDLDRLIAGK